MRSFFFSPRLRNEHHRKVQDAAAESLPPFEANSMRITDEMVERAMFVLRDSPPFPKRSLVANAIRAAMNPPPVVCKNCGSGEREHVLMRRGPSFVDSYGCPGYVFEAAP